MKCSTLVLLTLLSSVALAAESSTSTQGFCRQKWTTGETLNQRMYEHCIEELNDSALQVEAFTKAHSQESWFKDMAGKGCVERWTKEGFVQNEMVSYCYTREFESFNELKYQTTLASYNSGRAEACFKVWKSKAGMTFEKTEECYRKKSEAPNYALPRALLLLLDSGPATQTAGRASQPSRAN